MYVSKNITDPKLKAFVDKEIKPKGISYYYYTNSKDLFKQIKKSIFTIVRDAFLSKLNFKSIPETKLKNLSFDYDYSMAIKIIKNFEEIMEFHTNGLFDLMMTDLFHIFFEEWSIKVNFWKVLFIDPNLDQKFKKMMEELDSFSRYQSENTTPKTGVIRLKIKSASEEIEFSKLTKDINLDYKELSQSFQKFVDSYLDFKKYTFERKILIETHL
ncbi:hypothetical protein AB3N58_10430 [Leptospira sp. WS60.C2]